MAENHPVGFRWVIDAREKGATIIHVDPRFTRTSAMADMWVPLRAGSDTVFFGAMVNYVLTHGLEFRDYVVAYTNAATIIDDSLRWPRGSRWSVLGLGRERRAVLDTVMGLRAGRGSRSNASASALGLSDPRRATSPATRRRWWKKCAACRRTRSCASPAPSAARPDRSAPAAICYAVGLTQHSAGVQIIRTAAILQLLLGNIGRPGGGILALRGHASIQGSTDIPTLFDILPGYLPMPSFGANDCHARRLHRHASIARRLVGELRQVRDLAAQGVVRRPGDARERVRLRLAAPNQRGSLALRLLARHGRRPAGERE